MLEAVHEIAIYIHRFHNLDLFQQGWYQIKITMRWEDEDSGYLGIPVRVVQYEAPDLGSDDVHGFWRIDDANHSFSTQPFRIRYTRQDVILSMMVTFNLTPRKIEVPSTSAAILKFELLYTPVLESRSNIQDSLDDTAAVHEFRLLPKALLGVHTYCPVHFDDFHAVLVDVTVHVSLLKSAYTSSQKVMLVQALLRARGILLEDLQNLSQAINQPIDIKEIASNEIFGYASRSDLEVPDSENSGQIKNVFEDLNSSGDFQNDVFLHKLSEDKLLEVIDLAANQVLNLWSLFLNFHRANINQILEYLSNQWAVDRKAEWSIWMVYTKVKIPRSELHGGSAIPPKLTGDLAENAAKQAELHRQSITKMMIDNRSIQDMNIFGDPSRIPVVIVEKVISAPFRSTSGNSYFSQMDQNDTNSLFDGFCPNPTNTLPGDSSGPNGCVLKIVVFVHGFQGHHLDLRLIRNQWLLIDPKIEFLMSEANEDKTSGDFREMGQRLAQEVVSFLKKKMDRVSRSGVLRTIKLSFVGHSIGNIILRTALTDSIMEPYLGFLHTYLSVSGPHLGYLYSSNSLFNGGLWLMKKLKGAQCIHQLTFTDDPDLQNTFLYKLCKRKTLDSFKNVILLSSPQDGYVPYHSARIEACPASLGDPSQKGKIFQEMLNECLDQLRSRSCHEQRVLMRCDVDFDVSTQGKSLDTIIGRAAHIEFLDSDIFVRLIMWSFPELFR